MFKIEDLQRCEENGWQWTEVYPEGDGDGSREWRTDRDGEGLWQRQSDQSWSQALGHTQFDLRPAGDDPGAARLMILSARRGMTRFANSPEPLG